MCDTIKEPGVVGEIRALKEELVKLRVELAEARTLTLNDSKKEHPEKQYSEQTLINAATNLDRFLSEASKIKSNLTAMSSWISECKYIIENMERIAQELSQVTYTK